MLPCVVLLVPHFPVPYPVLDVIVGAVTVQLDDVPDVVQLSLVFPMALTPVPLV